MTDGLRQWAYSSHMIAPRFQSGRQIVLRVEKRVAGWKAHLHSNLLHDPVRSKEKQD